MPVEDPVGLNPAIQQYQTAMAALHPDSTKPLSELEVLAILTARDAVAAVMQSDRTITPPQLAIVTQADQILRQSAQRLAQFTASPPWRSSFNPDEKAWWWYLESGQNRFDWLWSATAIACLTISLSLVGDISTRFLTGGPDSFGALAVSSQSILTLLAAGGALTKAGQAANQRLLRRLHISEQYWHELGAAFSILLLLSLLGTRLALPWIATKYTALGVQQFEQREWGGAEAKFKRALQLNADEPQAHFWLGRLYEELQKPSEARPHYQLAAQSGILDASNNLARLYILDKNYSAAVSLLNLALENPQAPPETKHALLKNFGWARYEQGDLAGAESKLLEAIDLQKTAKLEKNIAAPYCLLAQVLDKQKKATARSQWELCNQHATVYSPDEDQWAILAQKRLATKESKSK
jgi:Tfp pilus assembly protein PilF